MEHVDFSQPLSALLRLSTREVHETAENSSGATALLSGQLPRDDYVKYLMMLWHIYHTFEDALDRHATHPALEPTYNPSLLRRTPALADDISYFLQVPLPTWKSHPAHLRLRSTFPAPLAAYLARIRTLADSADPAPLLAHSYVRYLGDLSGGQTIRRVIAKAYGLNEADGLGLKFYEFRGLMGSGIANQGEMRRIKEWFRDGMNNAGDLGVHVKAAVCEEAKLAFDLNTELFKTIQPVESISTPQPKEADDVLLEQTRSQAQRYSVAQVLPLIIAVSIAHFLFVAGGYTGDRGYHKLLQQWFAGSASDSL